jgi:hypothetical protein
MGGGLGQWDSLQASCLLPLPWAPGSCRDALCTSGNVAVAGGALSLTSRREQQVNLGRILTLVVWLAGRCSAV